MIYLSIAIAAIAPVLLIASGRRFLGRQTHPAALFILAWILCGFLLSMGETLPFSATVVSFAWVAVCYAAVALVKRYLHSRHKRSGDNPESEGKDAVP